MAGVFAASTLGLVGVAMAKENESKTNEMAIMANAKVTMAQAIATAESQVGGKAVGAGIEDQNGAVAFEVEVLKDGQKHRVLVDTQSGQVVKTAMADDEQNENGHEGDDD
jgi:uncharacterized membrane protein YkoI